MEKPKEILDKMILNLQEEIKNLESIKTICDSNILINKPIETLDLSIKIIISNFENSTANYSDGHEYFLNLLDNINKQIEQNKPKEEKTIKKETEETSKQEIEEVKRNNNIDDADKIKDKSESMETIDVKEEPETEIEFDEEIEDEEDELINKLASNV